MTGRNPAAMLLRQLREHDVELWTDAGRLRYSAPAGVMTDDVLKALRKHKAGLLELLDEPPTLTPLQPVSRANGMPL